MGRRLNREWMAKGCPEPEDMPRWMWHAWIAVKEEYDRRGQQLTLWPS